MNAPKRRIFLVEDHPVTREGFAQLIDYQGDLEVCGQAGTVVLEVVVDAQGRPTSIDVARRSGSRDLDRAAVEAVSRWQFEPARDAAGNPVAGSLSVPIDFKLQ